MESDVEIRKYLNRIRQAHPVIHCITNTVTMNDCANLALALGASPTMAHHEKEVEEIAAGAMRLSAIWARQNVWMPCFSQGKRHMIWDTRSCWIRLVWQDLLTAEKNAWIWSVI